jgi:hypothetical protein
MAVRVVAVPGSTSGESASDETRRPARGPSGEGNELLGWLQGLVWSLGPVAPCVVIAPGDVVRATITAGGSGVVAVAIRNRQATSVSAVFEPSALRSDDGVVWLPSVLRRSGVTIPATEERLVEITIGAPPDLPPGIYKGSLVALGFVGPAPELAIEVLA